MTISLSQGFALKFISGKYQGGEFPLRPEREVVIGRSSELDMVLVEEMVSRRHAKIECQRGKVTIRDLGSTNGTFVNGAKVTEEAALKPGDRILIGTSILKLVPSDGQPSRVDLKPLNRQLEEVAAAQPPSSGAMTGRLEEVPLPDLLQLFATSKKSGCLSITGEVKGSIQLKLGRVVSAELPASAAVGSRKALLRMLAWSHGRFVLDATRLPVGPEELDDSTEALLIDGLRQLDELKAALRRLPPLSSEVRLHHPLQAPLSRLSSAQLLVFQAVHNSRTLQQTLDLSPLADSETAAALVELFKGHYVKTL